MLQDTTITLAIELLLLAAAVGAFVLLFSRYLRRADTQPLELLADDLLFANAPCAVVLSDAQDKIVDVNHAYERLTGRQRQEVIGMPIGYNHSGQMDEEAYADMREALRRTDRWDGEFWLRNAVGEAFSDKVSRIAVRDTAGDLCGFLTISLDMLGNEDERRLMLWQAHHDTLTKLPNRNLFFERLTRVLMKERQGAGGALISVDLDNFKIVNDSIGAAKGDQLLTQAAFRIALCARETDTVARLAGDHFMVLMEDCSDYAALEQVAREIVDQVSLPFVVDDRELFVTASVGISVYPEDGSDGGELMQKADAARLQAKRSGGNNIAFFESAMNARAERRLEIESELRKAVHDDQFELHFQPVIDLRDGSVSGAEALVRWRHPEKGLVSPGEFIPVAEETGIINELGAWVVRDARRKLVEHHDILRGLRISVNVSAAQLKTEQAISDLIAVLAEEGCDGLTVELTESALIADRDGVQTFLEQIRLLGCRTSLDDFGTGFSSLSYLRDFRFDVLKIDKSFIDRLANTQDYGLVASIISMGRILGMDVVAEGVEEDTQVQRLRQIGCDYVQGFYYSKPLPFAEFIAFLRQERLKRTA